MTVIIEMTIEEFYFDDGYDCLTAKGIQAVSGVEEVLHYYPDNSWVDEEMGECDAGPYGGYWYAKWTDVDKGLFAILQRSDWSRDAVFFDTLVELEKEWESIHMIALETARDNDDLEYFNMTIEEYAETWSEHMHKTKIVVAEEDAPLLDVFNKAISLLERLNPTGYVQWQYGSPFGIVPAHAQEDLEAEWWSKEAPNVLEQLKEGLTEAAGASNVYFDLKNGFWGFHA